MTPKEQCGSKFNWQIVSSAPNDKLTRKTQYPFKLDALRDLVSSVQFKKRKKHSRRNVTYSKVTG